MRILLCSPNKLSPELGAPKVVVELAEALRELDWTCDLLGPDDLITDSPGSKKMPRDYPERLRDYLRESAHKYDVVDYDHEHLPYSREEFSPRPLFVARSVLLVHHLESISIPYKARSFKARIGHVAKRPFRRAHIQDRVKAATQTIQEADLVNVSNHEDKAELTRRGVGREKIVVIPFGLSRSRRPLFEAVSSEPPEKPVVAFVGTFDFRKGGVEFPSIVQRICEEVPDVRFRLLGTKGMFRTSHDVLARFPRSMTQRIEVIPTFRPEQLPALLSSCSVGVFPSYMEGFPFSVLEMLAASLPVIAYDAPGSPMMLPPEYLVPRGNSGALSAKIINLLTQASRLRAARLWAKEQSRRFCWSDAAKITNDLYLQAIANRR
jgi:glycosyltransferase involved in cell wall biosynthesis